MIKQRSLKGLADGTYKTDSTTLKSKILQVLSVKMQLKMDRYLYFPDHSLPNCCQLLVLYTMYSGLLLRSLEITNVTYR